MPTYGMHACVRALLVASLTKQKWRRRDATFAA